MKDNKILKNELMSDEELEQVAGGTTMQVSADSYLLYEHGRTIGTVFSA